MIVTDMPFLSHHLGVYEAVKNAGALISEGGAAAVKIEGGEEICEVVRAITAAGIPVMGHLGLTPQSVNQLGGFGLQAKTEKEAEKLIKDAKALEAAGSVRRCFGMYPQGSGSAGHRRFGYPDDRDRRRARAATGRSWCSMICSVCSATTFRRS